jgi:hypothetical protein
MWRCCCWKRIVIVCFSDAAYCCRRHRFHNHNHNHHAPRYGYMRFSSSDADVAGVQRNAATGELSGTSHQTSKINIYHHHYHHIIKSSPHQSAGIQTLSRAAPTSCGASSSSCDAMVIPRPEDQMVRFQPLHTPLYSNSSWGMEQTSCVFVLSFCFIFFEGVWFGRLTIRAGVSSHGKRQLEAKEAVISEMCNGAGAGGADDDLNACEKRLKPHSKILYSFAR